MISERQLFIEKLAQTSDIPLMLEIESANGIFLFDKQGKKYIDLISGISVSSLGHNNKRVVSAIKKQLDKHMHLMVYGEFVQSVQVRLADKLTSLLPDRMQSVYYVNSGTEANEGAMKLAKRYTGREKVITFNNAYHGSTHGSLSLMGNEFFKTAFRPLLPGIEICDFNDPETLKNIDCNTAAVFIEPIQGEAGIRIPSIDFIHQLRQKCDREGALLVFDEIQTGFGRTGKMFGFEHFGVVPDIMTFAKAFGGGMPLGAFVSSKKIMDCLSVNPVLGHITTFGGHPVSCSAALEAINIITENNIIENVNEKSKLFKEQLVHPKIKETRGTGLFMAIQLNSFEEVRKVIVYALEHGLITDWFLFCDNALRLAPPLIINENEIKMACGTILEALDQL